MTTGTTGVSGTAISVEHLGKDFGDYTAVRDVSFEVSSGSVVALLGPNGAGKTTTIEILEGFSSPSRGEARVLGTEPQRGGRAWRARIGLVLQSTSLDPQLTVREAIALYARMFANPFPVDAVLDMVELVKDADTRIGALSGGQRRRADLGLGIVGRPEVLFLDEPTTGLDPEARRATWSSVANLAASGSTVLMTTHYLDEAQQLAERIIVLAEGRVVADSTPDELRTSNSSPLVHYRVPDGVDVTDLPIGLAEYFDATTRQLSLRTSNVTATLTSLTSWARDHDLDLAGVEVGPPSLEDAYLALTARHHAENENGGSR